MILANSPVLTLYYYRADKPHSARRLTGAAPTAIPRWPPRSGPGGDPPARSSRDDHPPAASGMSTINCFPIYLYAGQDPGPGPGGMASKIGAHQSRSTPPPTAAAIPPGKA